jgi:Zn-dependent peptidase ImmA (M78 family)
LDRTSVQNAAAALARIFQLSSGIRASWGSRDEALKWWIRQTEAQGVFVFQSSAVEPDEARGFVLQDSYAPFIFLNAKEARAARIFTLIHELVHLLIGAPGLSNLRPIFRPRTEADRIEVFCNAVAGEVLVPTQLLAPRTAKVDHNHIREFISDLSSEFRVSTEVVARRLLDMGVITPSIYRKLRKEYQDEWKRLQAMQKKKRGGPAYDVRVVQKNGAAFVRLTLGAMSNGKVTVRDVSRILNVKLAHLHKVAATAGKE